MDAVMMDAVMTLLAPLRPLRRALPALLCLALPAAGHAQGGGGSVSGEIVIRERSGGQPRDVASAVVYLEVPGRVVRDGADPALLDAAIEMKGREFLPHVRPVLAGTEVAFPNKDPFSHNVFSNSELGPFDLGLYRRGSTRATDFGRPGVYPIYCNIHSKMVSFVVATPTPWVTRPSADGRFVLAGVPEGSYVLHVWHERAGEVERDVTVTRSGGAVVSVELDGRAFVAGPHLNKFGRPYAATRADRY
jgi:plastocyanin